MFLGDPAPFIPLVHSEALAGLGPLIFRVCKVEPSLRQREQEGLLGTSARDRSQVLPRPLHTSDIRHASASGRPTIRS